MKLLKHTRSVNKRHSCISRKSQRTRKVTESYFCIYLINWKKKIAGCGFLTFLFFNPSLSGVVRLQGLGVLEMEELD